MSGRTDRADVGWWILLIICVLLPLTVIFLMPAGALVAGPVWFWLTALLCLWFLLAMMPAERKTEPAPAGPRILPESELPEIVRDVMRVDLATEQPEGIRIFRGRLKQSADSVYMRLRGAFARDTVPLLQEDPTAPAAIVLMPRSVERETLERPVRPWVNWLLFALTVVTTTWAGPAHQGINLLRDPGRFGAGLPYSIALLAILGVHELGHYFTARHHRIRVTPPYFIPVPIALGTFGAFIQMRSPTENRDALFDVAVAGPLAGLVVAIPALLIGLHTSTVIPGDAVGGPLSTNGTSAGSSILFALLAKVSLGPALEYGHVLRLSPLAFAGWLGLMVTALNLLPIGQLDGGHIAYAMFGHRVGTVVSTVAMWSLVLLAIFVWLGLVIWAILVFFIAGTAIPPLNDLTPLTPARQGLGYVSFVVLLLILMPLPHSVWADAGIQCPYV